jgi:hypothetical protein
MTGEKCSSYGIFAGRERADGAQWRSLELFDSPSQGTVEPESSSYSGWNRNFTLTTDGTLR